MKKNILTAEEIKKLISIEQVLSVYGIQYTGQRIPCPIHNGTNKNFSVQGDKFHCFVCNATGDIFSLVQHLSNYDFKQAKDFICDCFNLKRRGTAKQYRRKILRLAEESTYKKELDYLRKYQQARIRQTLFKLKGTFAEPHLKALLARYSQKDFFLKLDIHAYLISLLQRYGAYRPMIIITDKNKDKHFQFEKDTYQLAEIQKDYLPFGDYSLRWHEKDISIIVKGVNEIVPMIQAGSEYWEQAKQYKYCALVLTCSYMDIVMKKYEQEIKQEAVLTFIFNLSIKYGVKVFYCDNENGAEYAVYKILENYLHDKQEQLEKVLLHVKE